MKLSKKNLIWFDNEFIPAGEAHIDVMTYSLHYGLSIFEGLRAYETAKGPAIFRLPDHTDRLFNSAKILNLKIPFSKTELNQAQIDLLAKNHLKSAYIRPIVFCSTEDLGLHMHDFQLHVAISAWPWGKYFKTEHENAGIKALVSSYRRHHVNSSFLKAKISGNYINSILAIQEAKMLGFDEAIMLDQQGFISEASSSNIFLVKDHVLYTPTIASVLPGVTRDSIMKIATDLGICVIEKTLTRDEAYTADEMFFTGTAVEITAVSEVDGRTIGNGQRGTITKQLDQAYSEIVQGKNKEYQHWLSYLTP